ncbi:hypothetical protein MtrunA17_Chr6g0455241 [Medicago truncatula]|uniref:Transmembrane protein n=1 Tax=Medicago truncatula TaxID=3880 RepID=A0A396HA82_MEDTR|nr:hypothetical protein MtrunA17_Chr6g0455241 [Medicago truncatula]
MSNNDEGGNEAAISTLAKVPIIGLRSTLAVDFVVATQIIGVSLLLLVILIRLLHLSKTTSLKIKGCTSEDCLINNDLESEEFSMSSHAARMLLDLSQTQTGRTGNNNGAAVKCPIKKGYRTCLPSQNGGGPNNRCGTYNRVC